MPALSMIPAAGEFAPDPELRNPVPQDHAVLQGVFAALGRPPGLFRAVVRPLWKNHYRVNVFLGGDITSAWIAHNFFVEAGAAGEILTTTPRITRQYS